MAEGNGGTRWLIDAVTEIESYDATQQNGEPILIPTPSSSPNDPLVSATPFKNSAIYV